MYPEEPRVSACIVLYHSGAKVLDTIQCVLDSQEKIELYLINNDASDNTARLIQENFAGHDIRLLENSRNIGFGQAHNMLCGKLRSRYHIVMNPDVTFAPDLVGRMVDYMEQHRDVVILTPRLMGLDGREQFVPRMRPTFAFLAASVLEGFPGPFHEMRMRYTLADQEITQPMDVTAATGCFLMIRTPIFYKVRGFDKRFFLYMEDSDLSLKALQYGHIVYHPDFVVTHGWTRGDRKDLRLAWLHFQSAVRFLHKWGWR